MHENAEYLDTLGLVKSYFFKFFEKKNREKNRKKKISWCSDAPEDEAISLFVGLLANPDVPLSPRKTTKNLSAQDREERGRGEGVGLYSVYMRERGGG
jgi:hypothetical protein